VTSIILGASAGLGRELSRAMAAEAKRLVLIARDAEHLSREAAHLRTLYGIDVIVLAADARDPVQLVDRVRALVDLNDVTALLCPIGMSRSDDDGTLSSRDAADLIAVNLLSIVALSEAVAPGMRHRRRGTIVAFGSIAAVRGRGANVVYAASKRGLESYFESLRHRESDTGVMVQLYRLGYLDTRQAFGKALLFPKATPAKVARSVVYKLDRDVGVVTIPWFWAIVAIVVRLLPWRRFKRLRF
jgi:short-subunit dehydrogenase